MSIQRRDLKLFSYNSGSNGAKQLAAALGIKRIKHNASGFQPTSRTRIINWGCGPDKFPFPSHLAINRPDLVKAASNKLAFFQAATCRTPDWTTDQVLARSWVDEGHVVVARRILAGHSGAGIVIIENALDFVPAPLYTKYVKKEAEYRVHFAFGRLTDVQRKIKRPDFVGDPNWRVRNHQNGFIYVRNDVKAPEDVQTQALQAAVQSGLDFGAVDVIWNKAKAEAYVLEINTAPGISGTTVQKYSDVFHESLDLH